MSSCAVRSARSGVTVIWPSWLSRESEPGGVSALPWPWVSQRKCRPFGATCGSTPKVGEVRWPWKVARVPRTASAGTGGKFTL